MRLIDADEFIKELSQLYAYAGWDERDIHFSLSDIACNLEMMPVINVVLDFQAETPKHGHWISCDGDGDSPYKCSVCGGVKVNKSGEWLDICHQEWSKMPYCAVCGAKMDEVET